MKNIINPVQIENSSVIISCLKEQGTGFFITPSLILTDYHVVIEEDEGKNPIFIKTKQGEIICTINAFDKDLDICILYSESLLSGKTFLKGV